MVALATILMQVVAKATTFSRDFNQDENIVAIGGAISEIPENPYSYLKQLHLDQLHSCCNADIALSHPSCARMGHPNLTLSVKMF